MCSYWTCALKPVRNISQETFGILLHCILRRRSEETINIRIITPGENIRILDHIWQ
jgi:hypothetical protein